MRMGFKNRKRGFTLVETVVSVGIVAALAAVVYPVVARQYDTADPTRIQQDLSNIAVGIETFNVNNRALPGDLDDLANQLIFVSGTNTDTSITSATTLLPQFTVTTLWRGPYITASIVDNSSTDQLLTTGFGASIVDSFVCYDAATNVHGVSQGTSATLTNDNIACPNASPTQPFLAIQIISIACSTSPGSTFLRINELFDGVGEANADVAGRIRCEASGAGNKATNKDVVYFLASPIS